METEDVSPGLFLAEGRELAGGLRLYLMAYRARLLSALRDNFPVLHRLLGDEAFADLAVTYIAAHPSRFRSIRWFGDSLFSFLDANPDRLPHPTLADVARMDWAMGGAFDAQDAPRYPNSPHWRPTRGRSGASHWYLRCAWWR